MRVADLDFELPPDRIAQRPVPRRDAARLLVVHRESGRLEDRRFRDFPRFFAPDDLVVLNETRVLLARLTAERVTGGRVEVLLTRERGPARWEALVRPGRRVRVGDGLRFGDGSVGRVEERLEDGGRVLAFASAAQLARLVEEQGGVPLPPYIRRAPTAADRRRYQTVYARRAGAVAAPTAGLHFTAGVLRALRERGVRIARVSLHVGPGTFRPVEATDVDEVKMEAEPFEISARAAAEIASACRRGSPICGVGTTSVRTLETAARRWRRAGPLAGETDLCIRPPFEFRLTGRLLTNFHLPRSTPLLLAAAFAGAELLRRAYRHAVREGYRFYSYGDAMLVL